MFKSITLEMSLKPFVQGGEISIRPVLEQVFTQWRPLIQDREQVSVMLWVGDGSELLDYQGRLEQEFEWACWIGTANKPLAGESDSPALSLHAKKRYFQENPPKFTYAILKEIVSAIKEIGQQHCPGAEILVGETFDIGPEFAVSDFKYRRHPELCTGTAMGPGTILNSYVELNADDYPYAGFPQGIPQDTPFGTFLGRQSQIFLTDMDFDYLWLSNGVGFSANPWDPDGDIFDGEHFQVDKLPVIKEKVLNFWKLFRAECPEIPLRTRGTNFSAGIDYATDAVGLYDIYRADLNILPPPNSPWAGLNGNFGIELMGHMTRICELPGDEYLYRYYIHDPWWVNTPWYDRYNGQPHDIYLPMAISRIDEAGQVHQPTHLHLLSIDNSWGDMPDNCVNEPLPHLLKAEKDAPDAIAPLVWVYPLRTYTTSGEEATLHRMMAGDWFICRAINHGLPLNTVVSEDIFLNHDPARYRGSVLITPVPQAGSPLEEKLLNYVENGGKVVFYGPVNTASQKFLELFRLRREAGISGKLTLDAAWNPDTQVGDPQPDILNFRPQFSAGDLDTHSDAPGITADGYALSAGYKSAQWYRAPAGGRDNAYGLGHLANDDDCRYIRGEVLIRRLLEQYGYQIRFSKPTADSALPVLTLHRSDNAFILSAYGPNTAVETALRFPLGAPVLLGWETAVKDGFAHYSFPRAVHGECRVFVEQDSGVISAREVPPVNWLYRRRILVSGLRGATVRFFGETACSDRVDAVLNSALDAWYPADPVTWEIVHDPEQGTYLEAKNITGNLMLAMPRVEMLEH